MIKLIVVSFIIVWLIFLLIIIPVSKTLFDESPQEVLCRQKGGVVIDRERGKTNPLFYCIKKESFIDYTK